MHGASCFPFWHWKVFIAPEMALEQVLINVLGSISIFHIILKEFRGQYPSLPYLTHLFSSYHMLSKKAKVVVHVCDKVVKLFLVNCQLVLQETVIYIFGCFLWNWKIKDLFLQFPPLLEPQLPSSVLNAPAACISGLLSHPKCHVNSLTGLWGTAGASVSVNGQLHQTFSGLVMSILCFYFLKEKRLRRGASH